MVDPVELVARTDKPRARVLDEVVRRSRHKPAPSFNPFTAPSFPPIVEQALRDGGIPTIAQDQTISGTFGWAAQDPIYSAFAVAEGVVFLGYSYLAALAQRAEYRVVTETIAAEMVREWIEITVASGDDTKTDRKKAIEDRFEELEVRDAFRKCAESDGFFGRGHLYLDTGSTDDSDELLTDLGNGRGMMSRTKIGPDKPQKLIRLQPVEATWAYPTHYESVDPLKRDWYRPVTWYVMSREIHRSRFLTFIMREVPDILKPAYAFGGLSMSQMLKPYVDNWLRTRQSVSDLIQNFSHNVLRTNMDATTSVGGDNVFNRVALFNNIKNNQGTILIDKDSEDWSNVAVPLGGLDHLQAQCLPAETLIQTKRGKVPICAVTTDDEVLTRRGWAPLQFAGVTGYVDQLIEIETDHGITLRATGWHPIYLPLRNEFVNAETVKPGDALLLEEPTAPTNTAIRSSGAVVGGGAPKPVIIAMSKAVASCTGLYGKLIEDLSQKASTFIMSMTTGLTTNFPILSYAPEATTIGSIWRTAGAGVGTGTLSFDPRRVSSAESRLRPIFQGSGSIAVNAATPVIGVRNIELAQAEPVYNLEVVEGYLPEFYANGVLVHNSQEHIASIARIPLVKLLGIQPAGLNASSEGELISFEDWIASAQEFLFRVKIQSVMDFVQLSLFGDIDDDIQFKFKPLRQLKPLEEAQLEQITAQTREGYYQMGAVDAQEVREALAQDPDTPFDGLDLSKPMQHPPGMGTPGGMGEGGGPGEPPKGGGGPPPPPKPPQPPAGGKGNGFQTDGYIRGFDEHLLGQDREFREEDVVRGGDPENAGRFSKTPGTGAGKVKEPEEAPPPRPFGPVRRRDEVAARRRATEAGEEHEHEAEGGHAERGTPRVKPPPAHFHTSLARYGFMVLGDYGDNLTFVHKGPKGRDYLDLLGTTEAGAEPEWLLRPHDKVGDEGKGWQSLERALKEAGFKKRSLTAAQRAQVAEAIERGTRRHVTQLRIDEILGRSESRRSFLPTKPAREVTEAIADFFDYSPEHKAKIEITSTRDFFTLNGRKMEAAGTAWTHGPEKGKIEIRNETMMPGALASVAAHEINHIKWQTVYDAYRVDYTELHKMLAGLADPSVFWDEIVDRKGQFRDTERGRAAKEKYPVYDGLHSLIGVGADFDKFQKDDGITDYSREYWTAYAGEKGKGEYLGETLNARDLAIHETLAEMGRLDWESSLQRLLWYKESNSFKPLYDAIQRLYPKAAERSPGQDAEFKEEQHPRRTAGDAALDAGFKGEQHPRRGKGRGGGEFVRKGEGGQGGQGGAAPPGKPQAEAPSARIMSRVGKPLAANQKVAGAEAMPHGAFDPDQKLYLRIGTWNPETEQSGNYARGTSEAGVSVYELDNYGQPAVPSEGEWAEEDMHDRLRSDAPKMLVQGNYRGRGNDGEPLLNDLKVVGGWAEAGPSEDAGFKEEQHPRRHGQFASKGEGEAASGAEEIPDEVRQHPQFKGFFDRGAYHAVINKATNEIEFHPQPHPNAKAFKSGREDQPTKVGYYDPRYADLQTLGEEEPLIRRQIAVLKPGVKEDIEGLAEPDTIYRGMSAEEYGNILKTGEVRSQGSYNLGAQQEGLTYWSKDPQQAQSYASGFAPVHFKPTFTHPAYVVASRMPKETREVRGTGANEVGVARPIGRHEITGIWRGDPYAFEPGRYSMPRSPGAAVGGVAPRADVCWSRIEHSTAGDAGFVEEEHPRARAGKTAGQFVRKGQEGSAAPAAATTVAKPGVPPRAAAAAPVGPLPGSPLVRPIGAEYAENLPRYGFEHLQSTHAAGSVAHIFQREDKNKGVDQIEIYNAAPGEANEWFLYRPGQGEEMLDGKGWDALKKALVDRGYKARSLKPEQKEDAGHAALRMQRAEYRAYAEGRVHRVLTEAGLKGHAVQLDDGEALEIAQHVADFFDYGKEHKLQIKIRPEHKQFTLNGRQYEYGGAAYTQEGMAGGGRKGDIHIYNDVLRPESVAGVVAHEINHIKWQTVFDAYEHEQMALSQRSRDVAGFWDKGGVMAPSGELRSEEAKKQYPVYARLFPLIGHKFTELSKDDGCTDYSREYWEGYHKGNISGVLARHETLAEMGRLDWLGSLDRMIWYKESETWKPLYQAVQEIYPTLVEPASHAYAKTSATAKPEVITEADFERIARAAADYPRVVRTVAERVGFDPDKIKFSAATRTFTLNRRKLTSAAVSYHTGPKKGTIEIFTDYVTPETIEGVVAHEIMHQKFQSMLEAYTKEFSKAASEGAITNGNELKPGRADQYAIYAAMRPVWSNQQATLRETGGITPYARRYWGAYRKHKRSLIDATHEELAEMARLEQKTGKVEGTKEWQALYDTVNKLYPKVAGANR